MMPEAVDSRTYRRKPGHKFANMPYVISFRFCNTRIPANKMPMMIA